jgi:hypothetical protein
MVRVNSRDFDESIVFCGRGEEKNNFLMEIYLKNVIILMAKSTVYTKNIMIMVN